MWATFLRRSLPCFDQPHCACVCGYCREDRGCSGSVACLLHKLRGWGKEQHHFLPLLVRRVVAVLGSPSQHLATSSPSVCQCAAAQILLSSLSHPLSPPRPCLQDGAAHLRLRPHVRTTPHRRQAHRAATQSPEPQQDRPRPQMYLSMIVSGDRVFPPSTFLLQDA